MLLLAPVLLLCGLPVFWAMSVVITQPRALVAGFWDERMLGLFARTASYAILSALLAVVLSVPIAVAVGRSVSHVSRAIWTVLPVPLLLPTMVLGYGWSHVLGLMHISPLPQSAGDVARCVVVLAAWLWPVPAVIIGQSLRRIDTSMLEQAAIDGIVARFLLRRALAPAALSLAICTMLAMQEFSIFEPTGISVNATEVRMIFETGTLSSASNSIFGLVGGVGVAESADLPARAALALCASLPTLLLTGALSLLAHYFWRRERTEEAIELSPVPSRLRSGTLWTVAAWAIMLITVGFPVAAMAAYLHRPFNPVRIENEIHPQLLTSLAIALGTAAVGLLIAVVAAIHPPRWMLALAVINFLIGGQFTAIAILRVLNNTEIGLWLLDSNLAVVFAHAGRFAWIPLVAGAALHVGPWRAYREMAGLDGAGSTQIFTRIILGMGWPVLALATLLAGALSLTEVPATALLVPPSLIPMLLTYVHRQQYDPMLEASLLLCAIVLAIAWLVVGLWVISRMRFRFPSSRVSVLALISIAVFALNGCGKSDQPEAIWCHAGRGPGEVVYPRGITRAPDGTFFIVDRAARIQHLDAGGKFLNGWQMQEWAQGKPVGLTVDHDGNLWVPDTHYHRVIVFTPQGQEIKRFGTKGAGPGEFDLPTDIAFDRDGNIYVSEYGDNNRVQVFDRDLKFLRQFGQMGQGDGDLSRPQSLAIVDDLLYITDSCNHRISVHKLDGTFIKHLGQTGSAPGEYRFPYGLDVDDHGNLVVAEFGNNRVQLIDRNTGAGIASWGKAGRLPGELNYAWAVAWDNGRAIVVDAGNNRLQVVRLKPAQ